MPDPPMQEVAARTLGASDPAGRMMLTPRGRFLRRALYSHTSAAASKTGPSTQTRR
jgi:hypothetical protein